MWELEYKESWAPKNWHFQTVMLEKTLESPWDCKEIKPVNPKGNQSWIFIGRPDAETETPILWPPDAKYWLIEKDPDSWERLKAEGEGNDREWDGWMASPTQWTWVSVNSRRWWWTGRSVHGVAKSQTQLIDWIELNGSYRICFMWFGSSSSLISYFPLRRFTLVLVIHNTLTNQP